MVNHYSIIGYGKTVYLSKKIWITIILWLFHRIHVFRRLFSIHMTSEQFTEIKLIDMTGKTVKQVFAGTSVNGLNTITLNTNDILSGIYLIELKYGENVEWWNW